MWKTEAFLAVESEAGPLSRVYKSQTPGFPKATLSCVIIVTKEVAEGLSQEAVWAGALSAALHTVAWLLFSYFSPFPVPVRLMLTQR